jgi:hypothetical protein
MLHLSYLMYALAGVYTVLGVGIVRRLRKPTCRICLFREGCPHRPDGFGDASGKPCYEREKAARGN